MRVFIHHTGTSESYRTGRTEESSPPALLLRLWQWSSRREDSTATVAWFAGVIKRGIGTRLRSTELPLPPQSSATAAIRVRRRGNLRCRAPSLSTVAPTRRRKSRRFYPPPCTAKKQGRRQLPLEWDVQELPSPSRTAAMPCRCYVAKNGLRYTAKAHRRAASLLLCFTLLRSFACYRQREEGRCCRHATLPQCRPLSRRDHRRAASRCCYVAVKGEGR